MVGKKKWKIYELCAVRAMLKAQFADGDIIDNFPLWFPDAKHEVILSSIKHVQLDIFSADAYINLEAQWEDIPGKKGYLLGLFALGMERDEIANHIMDKYPTHRWPERIGKADAIDIATSTFHSCADIVGQASPISLYSEGKDAFVLVPAVLKEFDSGKTVEMIHEAGQRAVPLDHVVYILTRFRHNFRTAWRSILQKHTNQIEIFKPIKRQQPEYTNERNAPYQSYQPVEALLDSQVYPSALQQTLPSECISADALLNQKMDGMDDSMTPPQLLQEEDAATCDSEKQWQAERSPKELMSFKNNKVGSATKNWEDQRWESKEELLRAEDLEDLFDFSSLD